MRVYVKGMDEFFSWMDEKNWAYVVLRNGDELARGFPKPGSKNDVDLLVSDPAVEPIRTKYGPVSKSSGVKCDVYSVSRGLGADFLGHAYYPEALAQSVLRNRVRHAAGFYVPSPQDWLDSLIYHVAYQKAESSGFTYDDPQPGAKTKYVAELHGLMLKTGIQLELTLKAFHEHLIRRGYAAEESRLISYVQNDFAHHRKSRLFAELLNHGPGEMNLFVIRSSAVRHKAHLHLIKWLRRHYRFLLVKSVDWHARLIRSREMRGNKWSRGGKPWIAIVVFDPKPCATSSADRKIHPFVFNSTQFVKREMREWFIKNHPVRPSINPIHSTDNEAEAIGHFPLFFQKAEEDRIYRRLAAARRKLSPNPAVPADNP